MKTWTALPLFDFAAEQYAERKAQQENAHSVTTEEWRTAVWKFATEHFLPGRTQPFIFEELSQAYAQYAERQGLPIHSEKRAFAGLQQRLKKERKIAVVPEGFGRSYEGNLRPQYRSQIN